jgi:CRISPR/Cas system CSM-associated protein Csm3 (group 7 of RAMP superfamily)
VSGTPQRLDVAFRIEWESDWHSGSGEGSAGIDRLVRKRQRGGKRLAFLPGSQLKGVLRHQCERLAALLGCDVVSPHQASGPETDTLVRHFGPLANSGLLIDRLFGSRYQGECLFVDDALPAENAEESTRAHSRTSIDRVSGTARERTLFTTEVVPRAVALTGSLRARHPAGVLTCDGDGFPYEYALLLAGLLTVESLGGTRSAGMGRCRITVEGERVRWNGRADYPLAEALRGMDEKDWSDLVQLLREGMTA